MRINFRSKKNTAAVPELLSVYKKGNAKKALVIYVSAAVKQWIKGQYRDENFSSHSMHWESIEMVRLLNDAGFDVDHADCMQLLPAINWEKYQLVIDESNHIQNIPEVKGQKRIFYATGCYWMFQNLSEWTRLYAFRKRTGIGLPAERQALPLYAEASADMVTYFGGDFQKKLFTHPSKAFPLSISSAVIPPFREKDAESAGKNFIWLGSRGFIHKGLDVVAEAFAKRKDMVLHICANLSAEPGFFNWFTEKFSSAENIIVHGWMNVHDPAFAELAEQCIGTVYCSASEGGAGAVIQAMQFGCIPIVNESTALRGIHTGMLVKGDTAEQLIESVIETLDTINRMSREELKTMSSSARNYANKNHSREAYSESFRKLIIQVCNE